MITLLFTTNDKIFSRVIRLLTWSDYSHVDVVTPEGTLIGALATGGVQEYALRPRLDMSTRYEFRFIDGNEETAIAFLRTQLGRSYDWMGVISIFLWRTWHRFKKWFCSELAAAAAVIGGNTQIDIDAPQMTPGNLFKYTAGVTK